MDYKNIPQYDGEMSSSDLCDAIVEARSCDLPEIREATRLLVDDLRNAILNADKLYYLKSDYTNSPYVNEHFCVFIFDDFYYAEKFVEKNTILNLYIESALPEKYSELFSSFYNLGAEGVDFCNDNSSVTFGLEHYFLPDDFSVSSGRLFSRFIVLCMQEIRNDNRQYDRKEEIVVLLKKNIVAEALTANVFIPTYSDIVKEENKTRNLTVATMTTDNKEIFFPVYTNQHEFRQGELVDITLSPTNLLSYIEFVCGVAETNENVVGLAINPETVNFAMNKGIMEIVLENKKAIV